MSTSQKANLIGSIIAHLRFAANSQNRAFDEGDTFFALCFKSDAKLNRIAKLAGV